jgi:hypothetical protein
MKKPQAILATIALLLVIALPAFKQSPSVVLGRTINNLAYQPGETLKYRIHYGAINAGVVSMNVSPTTSNINGKTTYNLRVEGETVKSFDWAYKVRDKFESWVDQESQAPLRYAKTVRENNYFHQDVVIYDPPIHPRHRLGHLLPQKPRLHQRHHRQTVSRGCVYRQQSIQLAHYLQGKRSDQNRPRQNSLHQNQAQVGGRPRFQTRRCPNRLGYR